MLGISVNNIQSVLKKKKKKKKRHPTFPVPMDPLLDITWFIYFKALFSCKKHQGKIYKTQRVLVANLATNFWILVASTIILVALATVLGAISCPEYIYHPNFVKR